MTQKLESITFDRPWFRPILFGTIAIIFNFLFYYTFNTLGLDGCRPLKYVLDGIAVGMVAVYMGKAHRRRIKKRIEELAYLNHHVRNAVQIMVNIEYIGDVARRKEMIRESTDRIIQTIHDISAKEKLSLEDVQKVELPARAQAAVTK